MLAELGELLVAVHGQADQWRLRQGEAHREVLDDVGGAELRALRDEVGEVYDRWRAASHEHARLLAEARERAREIDSLTASLEEIETVDPQPGEDVALRAEDERLAHADTLRLAAGQALAELTGEEYAADTSTSARDRIGVARAALATGAVHDEGLRSLDERLHDVATLVGDLAADLAAYLDDVDLDPDRLAWVQQRRATLGGLTRKYGETVDDVLAWSGRAAARQSELIGADDRVAALAVEVEVLRAGVLAVSVDLSRLRSRVAADFGRRVSDELTHLAMGSAVVEVAVRPRLDPDGTTLPTGERVRLSRLGHDEVEILLAANRGAPPRSVAKAASGGELSRVMLALEVVGADRAAGVTPGQEQRPGPPTFVFDEVDAGVGGRAAVDVGARLAALAEHSQVIVVTHLAQVAAFADRHLVVRKADDGRVTSSSVLVVDGQERLRELSRMMGGDPDSAAGLAHAQDLVDQTSAARRARAAREADPTSPRAKATPTTTTTPRAKATVTRTRRSPDAGAPAPASG